MRKILSSKLADIVVNEIIRESLKFYRKADLNFQQMESREVETDLKGKVTILTSDVPSYNTITQDFSTLLSNTISGTNEAKEATRLIDAWTEAGQVVVALRELLGDSKDFNSSGIKKFTETMNALESDEEYKEAKFSIYKLLANYEFSNSDDEEILTDPNNTRLRTFIDSLRTIELSKNYEKKISEETLKGFKLNSESEKKFVNLLQKYPEFSELQLFNSEIRKIKEKTYGNTYKEPVGEFLSKYRSTALGKLPILQNLLNGYENITLKRPELNGQMKSIMLGRDPQTGKKMSYDDVYFYVARNLNKMGFSDNEFISDRQKQTSTLKELLDERFDKYVKTNVIDKEAAKEYTTEQKLNFYLNKVEKSIQNTQDVTSSILNSYVTEFTQSHIEPDYEDRGTKRVRVEGPGEEELEIKKKEAKKEALSQFDNLIVTLNQNLKEIGLDEKQIKNKLSEFILEPDFENVEVFNTFLKGVLKSDTVNQSQEKLKKTEQAISKVKSGYANLKMVSNLPQLISKRSRAAAAAGAANIETSQKGKPIASLLNKYRAVLQTANSLSQTVDKNKLVEKLTELERISENTARTFRDLAFLFEKYNVDRKEQLKTEEVEAFSSFLQNKDFISAKLKEFKLLPDQLNKLKTTLQNLEPNLGNIEEFIGKHQGGDTSKESDAAGSLRVTSEALTKAISDVKEEFNPLIAKIDAHKKEVVNDQDLARFRSLVTHVNTLLTNQKVDLSKKTPEFKETKIPDVEDTGTQTSTPSTQGTQTSTPPTQGTQTPTPPTQRTQALILPSSAARVIPRKKK